MKPTTLGACLIFLLLVLIGGGIWYNQTHSALTAGIPPFRLVAISAAESHESGILSVGFSDPVEVYRVYVEYPFGTSSFEMLYYPQTEQANLFVSEGNPLVGVLIHAPDPNEAVRKYLTHDYDARPIQMAKPVEIDPTAPIR